MEKEYHKNDIVEIIFKKDGEINYKIFKNIQLAETILQKYYANIRLDYHGVVDKTQIDQKLTDNKNNKICVISYVGKYSDKRLSTRLDIINRIKSGQVDFGILIFKRCREFPQCNVFHQEGSKAWANKFIKMSDKAIFLDDSEDHYHSVKNLNIPNLKSILFKGDYDDLVKIIKEEFPVEGGSYYTKYCKYKNKYLSLLSLE